MEAPPPPQPAASAEQPAPAAASSQPPEPTQTPSPSPSPSPAPDPAQPPPVSAPPPPSAAPSAAQNPPQLQPQSLPPSQSQPPPPQQQSQPQQPIQQPRPPLVRNRPPTPFPHFSHHLPSSAPPSSSASASASSAAPAPSPSPSAASQRGGLAIGVPAHSSHLPRAQQPVATYSSIGASPAFNQPFTPLPRMTEQSSAANAQVRQPIQGIQNIGMIGSLSTTTQIRPGGVTGPPQQRLVQPISRAASPSTNQTLGSQKFPNSGLIRGPSMVSSGSISSVPQQSLVSSQGKQMPASSSSFRPQAKPNVLQQRPHSLQQTQQPPSAASHQQQIPTSQQQQQQKQQQFQMQLQQQQQQPQFHQQHSSPRQTQEYYNQQNLQLRNQQQLLQQQPARPLGPATTKPNPPTLVQTNVAQPAVTHPVVGTDAAESGDHILGKRSLRELVSQIDPSEKLDSEVEDVLVEIAEDFVESVATFACSLAKHRKSTTLEAKDILLHVERNWNMMLPGYGGDEIKCYKKQFTNDIHKERLAVIKKSMAATGDAANPKNASGGPAAASSKSHAQKAPPIGSPKA
ncbi:transcription initiation factor TFIID subunit 12-like [Musa acuminata AAA Group]|uniref:transcription initiation factor TFIID subunit 12-like n=1 Tax=Musa acuminata AAA Group TaxID=214697 RepID=UPI0031E37E7F